jgi:hypothetical protein
MENYDNESVTFVAWPEIKGLHNVLTSLEKSAAAEKLLGQPIMPLHIAFTKPLLYRGKVKLHGTLHHLPPSPKFPDPTTPKPWQLREVGGIGRVRGTLPIPLVTLPCSPFSSAALQQPSNQFESRSLHNLQSIYTPTG